MSKTRWDRNRAARTQQWEADYVSLAGGIDQEAAALSIKPGRLAQCVNFEEVFGQQGYTFIKGYERFDGRSRPSQATYAIQPFTGGNAAINPADTATAPSGAYAYVVSQHITSGTIAGGDAAGYLLLTSLVGTWSAGEAIRVGGVTKATASEPTTLGSRGYTDHETALKEVREYLRGNIQPPVGSGAILGGAVFNNAVYCVRNVADGTSATLWKSTAAGWSAVRTGLHPGGSYRFEATNFSGATSALKLYGISGRGRLFSVDTAGTFTYAAPIWGSESLATDNVTIGTGAKNFTAATARDWAVGTDLTIWSQTDASKWMRGTVSAYNSATGALTLNVTSTGGAGTLNAWEIARSDYSDKPYMLMAYKNHMFLAFPQGQLQTSNVGDPMTYTSTSTLFGCGQDIVALVSLKGKALGIFCTNKIDVLQGSSQTDWDKETYTTKTGAIDGSLQENNGNAIFLNATGLTTLQATQSYGDFESAIFSRDVKKTIDAKRQLVIGSRMAAGNYQYRLYFSDKTCLRFTFTTGNAVLTPRDVSPTLSEYAHTPSCLFAGAIDGEERMFFGSSDGYVMEEDCGTSFDGQAIDYVVRLPYNHYKSPALDKQFHKVELELQCPDAVAINYRQFFDYDDGNFTFGGGAFDIPGVGGQFDVDAFDTFAFDMPNLSRAEGNLDGQGRNMALLLWATSDFVRPATLQGVLTFFTKLGVRA